MTSFARGQAELTVERVRRPFEIRAAERAAERPPARRDLHLELLVAVVVGAVIRGWHIWTTDFPLNDGGLFYVMVRDIQAAHYRLPAFTSYNGGHIPFGYSPLAFYVTAFLNDITRVGLTELFRFVPWAASSACIVALFFLARAMLPSRAAVAASLIAFAIVPRSFVWLLMGGGLTRSFGYFFALLALHQVWLLYTRRSLRVVPIAALFCALTVLSHLGTAPFVAFSAALFFLMRGRHREGVVGSVAIGMLTCVLTAPWWLAVMNAHGLAPFIAARATGGSILSDLPQVSHGILATIVGYAVRITGEGRFPLVLVLGLIGVIPALRDRRTVILPIWLVTILALDARAGFTYAMAPMSMLAGLGVVNVFWPPVEPRMRHDRWWALRHGALTAFATLVVAAMVAASTAKLNHSAETQVLTALSPAERSAMQWLAQHSESGARVLVLTDGPWQLDKASEWFPVLAKRVSVGTVQGTEWPPRGEFQRSILLQSHIRGCANSTTACLDSLNRDSALAFAYVYAPTGPTTRCCGPLLDGLRDDPRYETIYAADGAMIFARRSEAGVNAIGRVRAIRE